MLSSNVVIRPLCDSFGAEVLGTDLREPLSAELQQQLLNTFYERSLLVFPNQELTPQQHIEALRTFGEVAEDQAFTKHGFGGVGYISNAIEGGYHPRGEIEFHFDQINSAKPLCVISLYGIEVVPPGCGGETRFASMKRAYSRLPSALRVRLDGLKARHVQDAPNRHYTESTAVHPIALPHPVTGENILYLGRRHVDVILGLEKPESDALVDALLAYAYDPGSIYDHSWRPGDLVIWDNYSLQHARADFDPKYRRHLQKVRVSDFATTAAGD